MKKAIGILFFAAATLTGSSAFAQSNNGKGNGNNKNLQDTRADQPVILAPSEQAPSKDVPVVVSRPDVQIVNEDKANEKHRTKAEQRQHAEERSGGKAFSGNGNDGDKSKTKVKKDKNAEGFSMVKYEEDKKGKKMKAKGNKKAYKAKKRK